MEICLGDIILFAGSFAIRGYAKCNGQLLSISDNQSLYSLLGTQYGGDGRTTFALPKKSPMSMGQSSDGFGIYLICVNPRALYPSRN